MSESMSGPLTGPLSFVELAGIPVTRLKGVGPRKVEALEGVGVRTVADLLTYYPRRYVDRTRQAAIADLAVGEEATVVAEVVHATSQRTRRGQSMAQIDVNDGSGSLRLTFFNQRWRARQLQPGRTVVVFGRLERFRGRAQMANPVVDLIGDRTGRIVPIYPQSEKAGLATWEIAGWVAEALRRTRPRGIADPVPAEVLERWELIDRQRALEAGARARHDGGGRDRSAPPRLRRVAAGAAGAGRTQAPPRADHPGDRAPASTSAPTRWSVGSGRRCPTS